MTVGRRQVALGLALTATLAATAWIARHDESADVVAPPVRAAVGNAHTPSAAAAPVHDPLQLARTPFKAAAADPFAARSWAPPAVEKPQPPTAPPLPYTYFGRMAEDGRLYVFLQRGERSYTVTSGELLDQQYRVEEITPGAIVLTYLPLKQRQVLPTGD